MSHQGQPTLQPASRTKKALRPACRPSPCREWKVSTTGRDGAAVADAVAITGRGAGEDLIAPILPAPALRRLQSAARDLLRSRRLQPKAAPAPSRGRGPGTDAGLEP